MKNKKNNIYLANVPRQPSRSDDQIPEKSQPACGAVEPNPKSKRVGIGWTSLFAFIPLFRHRVIEPNESSPQSYTSPLIPSELNLGFQGKIQDKFVSLISGILIFYSQWLRQSSLRLECFQRSIEKNRVVCSNSYIWVQDIPGGLARKLRL